jgi:hypothetical protein
MTDIKIFWCGKTFDSIHVSFILRSIRLNGAGALCFCPQNNCFACLWNIYDLLYKTMQDIYI